MVDFIDYFVWSYVVVIVVEYLYGFYGFCVFEKILFEWGMFCIGFVKYIILMDY